MSVFSITSYDVLINSLAFLPTDQVISCYIIVNSHNNVIVMAHAVSYFLHVDACFPLYIHAKNILVLNIQKD